MRCFSSPKFQVDASRSTTVVIGDPDDQSSNSEQSPSPSWKDSDQTVTDAPIFSFSSAPDVFQGSPYLTSEESKSIEESSAESLDSGTVSSPNISLQTGSEADVHSPPENPSCTEHQSCGENAPQNSSNTAQPRPGYKIVIDNIDKNVKPRNMSVDAQTKSLHYVQIYSVKDRMDFGKLSDVPPSGEKCLYDILPTTDDYEKLKTNFSVHVARVMVEYIPFFSENFCGTAARHIPHKYSREMSLKSDVVSCNSYGMASILRLLFLNIYYTCRYLLVSFPKMRSNMKT